MRRLSSLWSCSLLMVVASSSLPAAATLGDPPLRSTYLAGNAEPLDAFDAPVLLQFWASWCQSCSGVTRDLAGVASQSSVARHVAISTDETVSAAQAHADMLAELSNGQAAVVHDTSGLWAKRYHVDTVPTVIVLDHSGNELGRVVGHPGSADLTQIAALLLGTAKPEDHQKPQ